MATSHHEEEKLVSMSLGDHLEELRARLIMILLGLFIGTILSLFFGKTLLGILRAPFDQVIESYEKKGQLKREGSSKDQEDSEKVVPFETVVVLSDPNEGFSTYTVYASAKELLAATGEDPADSDNPSTMDGRHAVIITDRPVEGLQVLVTKGSLRQYLARLQVQGVPIEPPLDAKTYSSASMKRIMGPAMIVTQHPVEGFMVYMKTCIFFGLLLTSPWTIWQIWAFVSAGLYRKEKKYIHAVAPASGLLFISGSLFFMLFVAPMVMGFLIRFNIAMGWQSLWSLQRYINMVLALTLVFGASFQMPIAIVFAERLGLVTVENLAKSRKYVVLFIVIIAAVVTPPDIVSQVSLAIPLYGLYEASIVFCRIWRRRDKRIRQKT
ncbi:MAG: twin-arginine translocase subunit TatC [Sedimentisphaerales bacterium]|nr:twin-arginine translocase subunit TatC [Sedimentisphaerales bacterium]